MSADFDVSELRAFAVEIGNAPIEVASEAKAVISRGALSIKRQLTAEMGASDHFKGAASSMSYDMVASDSGIEAMIGPDKDRGGGALANIAYFGTSRGGGSVPDPLGALDAEAPNVEKYLADVMAKAVGG